MAEICLQLTAFLSEHVVPRPPFLTKEYSPGDSLLGDLDKDLSRKSPFNQICAVCIQINCHVTMKVSVLVRKCINDKMENTSTTGRHLDLIKN